MHIPTINLCFSALLKEEAKPTLSRTTSRYPVAITPEMAALIDPDVSADPIARQFLPDLREFDAQPNEHADPIGDHAHSPVKGIVHRYPDRVLLKLLHVCPVYCRFCFRREMVGPDGEGTLTPAEQRTALAYIAKNPQIWEVILTGGDPFLLSPRRMAEVGKALAAIEHVKIVRWHTRVPVVDTARVTDELVSALGVEGKTSYVAIHANHPRELTPAMRAACRRLLEAGLQLLSQSVLLKGVNNDAATLEALFRGFVEIGIRPYYLHQMDLAPGTSHFRTTIAEGQALMRRLRGRLSGLSLPTYVLDIPGGYGKVPIGPEYLEGGSVEDWRGERHSYPV